jgi:hypothetical protein
MHIPAAGSIKDLRPGHDIQFVLIVEKEVHKYMPSEAKCMRDAPVDGVATFFKPKAIFHLLVDMNFSNDPCLGHSVLICVRSGNKLSFLSLMRILSRPFPYK